MRSSLLATAVALAANGFGVVVVPPSIVAREPKLVTQRLIRPTIERVIGVHFRRERSLSPAADAFLQVLSLSPSAARRRRHPPCVAGFPTIIFRLVCIQMILIECFP